MTDTPLNDDLLDRVASAIFRGTRTKDKIDGPWEEIKRVHPDIAETYQHAALVVVEELNLPCGCATCTATYTSVIDEPNATKAPPHPEGQDGARL